MPIIVALSITGIKHTQNVACNLAPISTLRFHYNNYELCVILKNIGLTNPHDITLTPKLENQTHNKLKLIT